MLATTIPYPEIAAPALFIERLRMPREEEVDPASWAAAQTFGSRRRRQEFLTWRALVRRVAGPQVQFGYDAVGAPQLIGSPLRVSVSHCAEFVAVVLAPGRCAVDVEMLDRNFAKVADRYLAPAERLLSADPLFPAAVWCAKEALYKYAGRSELDLLDDLRIETADLSRNRLTGRIAGEAAPVTISLLHLGTALAAFIFRPA